MFTELIKSTCLCVPVMHTGVMCTQAFTKLLVRNVYAWFKANNQVARLHNIIITQTLNYRGML